MLHKILEPYKIVLASSSPRRIELFKMLKIPFVTKVSDIAEEENIAEPVAAAKRNAQSKAEAVSKLCRPEDIIVSADTIVVLAGAVLGKPLSQDMAAKYLSLLSGKKHEVISAVCIFHQGQAQLFHQSSQVLFAALSDDEIQAYIASKEPMDKAGAYGIQGLGSQFICGIEGCYFNVMGFPIHSFYQKIKGLHAKGEL